MQELVKKHYDLIGAPIEVCVESFLRLKGGRLRVFGITLKDGFCEEALGVHRLSHLGVRGRNLPLSHGFPGPSRSEVSSGAEPTTKVRKTPRRFDLMDSTSLVHQTGGLTQHFMVLSGSSNICGLKVKDDVSVHRHRVQAPGRAG